MEQQLYIALGWGAPVAAALFAVYLVRSINAARPRQRSHAAYRRSHPVGRHGVSQDGVHGSGRFRRGDVPDPLAVPSRERLADRGQLPRRGRDCRRPLAGSGCGRRRERRFAPPSRRPPAYRRLSEWRSRVGRSWGSRSWRSGPSGVAVLYYVFGGLSGNGPVAVEQLFGFSLGASSIALFARVGGGIYTKAADVAGDLSGKVEAGIPEDDPRNPATIADSVGDNVGDVAGMGADLFESYVGSIISAIALAWALTAAGAADLWGMSTRLRLVRCRRRSCCSRSSWPA